jgi:hypothetical protein
MNWVVTWTSNASGTSIFPAPLEAGLLCCVPLRPLG